MVQRVYLINKGEVVFNGPPKDLVKDPVARECYFGRDTVLPPDILEYGNSSSDSNDSVTWESIQSAPKRVEQQNVPQENAIASDASELPDQTNQTIDSDLSELLPPEQTNEVLDNSPSPKLADFFQTSESTLDETSSDPLQGQNEESNSEDLTNQTNNQQQRKSPPSGPVIKPFRWKK